MNKTLQKSMLAISVMVGMGMATQVEAKRMPDGRIINTCDIPTHKEKNPACRKYKSGTPEATTPIPTNSVSPLTGSSFGPTPTAPIPANTTPGALNITPSATPSLSNLFGLTTTRPITRPTSGNVQDIDFLVVNDGKLGTTSTAIGNPSSSTNTGTGVHPLAGQVGGTVGDGSSSKPKPSIVNTIRPGTFTGETGEIKPIINGSIPIKPTVSKPHQPHSPPVHKPKPASGTSTTTSGSSSTSAVRPSTTSQKIKQNKTAIEELRNDKADKTDVDAFKTKTGNDITTLNGKVTTNTGNITKLGNDKADKTDVDAFKTKTGNDIVKANEKITANQTGISTLNSNLAKTNTQVAKNTADINTNKTAIQRLDNDKADKTELEKTNQRVTVAESEIKINYNLIQRNQVDIADTNKRIDVLTEDTNKRFDGVDSRISTLDGKLSSGVAGSIALASMPSVYDKGAIIGTVGVGTFNSKQAVAVGLTGASENGKYSYKIGAGFTKDGTTFGAGLGIRFK